MRAVRREVAAALGFAVLGVAVSLAIALPQYAGANPDPGVSYVWRGMNPSGQYCYPWSQFAGWHPCWHDDETAGDYTAIDYSFYPPYDCTGEAVWLDYTGDFQRFKMAEYTGYCTGVRAKLYHGSYNEQDYVGDINYLHVDKNDFWMDKEVPYQAIYIGDVRATDNPGCSTAPHLHQSADAQASSPFYSNKLGKPTENYEWEHAILWESGTGDHDGDIWFGQRWTNERELHLGTDPFDRCPDNTADAAWPPDFDNNTAVNISEVQQYAGGRLGKGVGEDLYWKRLDLDANGALNITDMQTVVLYMGKQCSQ